MKRARSEHGPSAFDLSSPYAPKGDQPSAIRELSRGLRLGVPAQTLMGATGTGKTFTAAHVIAEAGRPALVMSHNKTLAAQLYGELKSLFPRNAVEYFISYYDYYQPEAYVPSTDTYIEKDASINDDIERLRHRATSALAERRDVIVVASVSCIYGLGDPEDYRSLMLRLEVGQEIERHKILRGLVAIHYRRNDVSFERGTFRVRGDTIEIIPAYHEHGLRVELWGDEIERITEFEALTGNRLQTLERVALYPASHYAVSGAKLEGAIPRIREDLKAQTQRFLDSNRLLEAQRIETRTLYDIEMMAEMGTCPGIENYSLYTSSRSPGDRPACLLDHFPDDFLTIVDESHVTVPQVRAMYRGDRSRKQTLVEHGFRLPSALDNRPLRFEEWEEMIGQAIFVSATPGDYELIRSGGAFTEQIIRPTGLLDPEILVKPAQGQVDDLLAEIRAREKRRERVLVTTLTKRMAEDLSEYLQSLGTRVRYMHADVDTIERMEIIRMLRLGRIDVLVGINLLREGLDLPEVSLVAVLDADKEGFLRNARSLIQTVGRAARNARGKAILYADRITGSMEECIRETNRRRAKQEEHNRIHGITPKTIRKTVEEIERATQVADAKEAGAALVPEEPEAERSDERIRELEEAMKEAAEVLDFERAAELRDRLAQLGSR